MSQAVETNLLGAEAKENPRPMPKTPITRQQIEKAGCTILYQGKPNKADLLETDLGFGPVVIKDYANKSWWTRLLGRFQIRRECDIYQWIGPFEGIPKFFGRVDAHALAIEKIDGPELCQAPGLPEAAPQLYEKFRNLVDRLHAHGLLHMDLRARKNVRCTTDGQVRIIDFGTAGCLRPGGIAHRLFFNFFRHFDDMAVLKYKRHLGINHYTEAEQKALRRFNRIRWLWPFNRKKKKQPS